MYLKCILLNVYNIQMIQGLLVYVVLDLRHLVVTSPSPINVLRISCSIQTCRLKTNFKQELIVWRSGRILYYYTQTTTLFTFAVCTSCNGLCCIHFHLFVLFFLGPLGPFIMAAKCKSDSSDVFLSQIMMLPICYSIVGDNRYLCALAQFRLTQDIELRCAVGMEFKCIFEDVPYNVFERIVWAELQMYDCF